MTPQQQKIQAQLDLRAQELDAKEAYLNKLDKAYEQVQLDIKVADKTIKVRETQLDDVVKSLNVAKEKLDELNNEYLHREKRLNAKIADIKNDQKRQNEKLSTITQNVQKQRTIRDELDNETRELNVYKKEQESLIKEAIEAGNDKLLEAKSDVAKFTDQIDQLRLEVSDLEQRKINVSFDVLQVESSFENTRNALEQEELELQKSLNKVQKQVQEASINHKLILKETEEKLTKLKAKEISILAKQDALIEERSQLETEKRRWNSTKSLYDDV